MDMDRYDVTETERSPILGNPHHQPAGNNASIQKRKSKYLIASLVILVFCVTAIVIGVVFSRRNSDDDGPATKHYNEPSVFAALINDSITDGIMAHLRSFESLSVGYKAGSRSVAKGYNTSAGYVEATLSASDTFVVYREHFVAPVWTELETPTLTLSLQGGETIDLAAGVDFQNVRYSGSSSNIVLDVVRIPNYGCDISDFPADLTGQAAVMVSSGGACNAYNKTLQAQLLGAQAVILYVGSKVNGLPNSRVRETEWVPSSPKVTIPAFGASYVVGKMLASVEKVTIFASNQFEEVPTFNLFADTTYGDNMATILVGAHLDSVPEGPGINDNGSGSATLLEMAVQFMKENIQTANKVRFAWFAAEEEGLIGSRNYVRSLPSEANENSGKIKVMLNFDMLGSPNYARQIYNGTGAPENTRKFCETLQKRFETYFDGLGLSYELIPFSKTGGSDYFPFIHNGIPAGSIATGAGGYKSMAERATVGGIANCPYDSCYHQSCDTMENINQQGLAEMAGAAAFLTMEMATAAFAGDGSWTSP